MTEIPAPSGPVREAADWLLDDHDSEETVTLLDPPLDVLWGLARAESDPRAAPSITVITSRETLTDLKLALFVDNRVIHLPGVQELRQGTTSRDRPPLIDSPRGTLPADGEVFRHATAEEYKRRWGESEPLTEALSFSTPVLRAATDRLSERFATDFRTALDVAVTHPDPDEVDLSRLATVVAARDKHTQKRLGEWTEETQIGSAGRVSATKRRLERAGVVDSKPLSAGGAGGKPNTLLLTRESEQRIADDGFETFLADVLDVEQSS